MPKYNWKLIIKTYTKDNELLSEQQLHYYKKEEVWNMINHIEDRTNYLADYYYTFEILKN